MVGARWAGFGLRDPLNHVIGQIFQHDPQRMRGQMHKGCFGLCDPRQSIVLCRLKREMALHDGQSLVQVILGLLALCDGAVPKGALCFSCQSNGFDHWQREFSFAKIIADIFTNGVGLARIVQKIINDLKGNA